MHHRERGGSINRCAGPSERIRLLQSSGKCPTRAPAPMGAVLQHHGSAQKGSESCKAQPEHGYRRKGPISIFSLTPPSKSHIHSCSSGERKSGRLSLGKIGPLMSSSATVLESFHSDQSFSLFVSTLSQPRISSSTPHWHWIRIVSLAGSLFG